MSADPKCLMYALANWYAVIIYHCYVGIQHYYINTYIYTICSEWFQKFSNVDSAARFLPDCRS